MDITGIERLLLSTHTMLGMMVAPEFAIDQTEATMLASGIANVQRHYSTSEFSEKTWDWLNLAGIVGAVYGTRAVAMRARWSAQNRAAKAANPQPTKPEGPRPASNGAAHIPGVGTVVLPSGLQ